MEFLHINGYVNKQSLLTIQWNEEMINEGSLKDKKIFVLRDIEKIFVRRCRIVHSGVLFPL
jgi:hypothetical protein